MTKFLYHKKLRLTPVYFLILIVLGIGVYVPSFSGSFHFDDKPSIIENPFIMGWNRVSGLWDFWPTRFVLYFTFTFDYCFWRLNVAGYHLTNLGIHIVNAGLVYLLASLVLRRLVPERSSTGGEVGRAAFFAALIFLVHPLQTEAVTYIVQRATSLAALFYLLSLVFYLGPRKVPAGPRGKNRDWGPEKYLRYLGVKMGPRKVPAASRGKTEKEGEERKEKRGRRIYYFFSLISFGLALLTKEMAVSLPLILLLVEVIVPGNSSRRSFRRVIPFIILACLVPILVLLYPGNPHYNDSGQIDIIIGRTTTDLLAPGGYGYFLAQFRVMVTYLRLLILPIGQNLDYDYQIFSSIFQRPVFLSFVAIVAMILVGFKAVKEKNIIGFFILWFFILLLPESSVIPIKDLIYEHRLYLVLVGPALLGGWYYSRLRWARPPLIVVVICLSLLTLSRNRVWRDDLSLWRDTAAKSPGKARPHLNLGLARAERGEWESARDEYLRAVTLEPRFYKCHDNLGVAYRALGKDHEAAAGFREAIRLGPEYLPAYNNLALLYLDHGRDIEAGDLLQKALSIDGDDHQTLFNYALFLKEAGDLSGSESAYRDIIGRFPEAWKARMNLALVLMEKGKPEEAEAELLRAISLNPASAVCRYSLGNIYAAQGEYDRALIQYRRAVILRTDYPDAYNNLANTLKALGRPRESGRMYLEALERDPEQSGAPSNLTLLLLDNPGDAELREAVRERLDRLEPGSLLRRRLEQILREAGGE